MRNRLIFRARFHVFKSDFNCFGVIGHLLFCLFVMLLELNAQDQRCLVLKCYWRQQECRHPDQYIEWLLQQFCYRHLVRLE